MIPELGQFALVLSAVIALFLGAVPLAGTLRHNVVWQSLARPAALLQFVLVSFAFACFYLRRCGLDKFVCFDSSKHQN